MKSSYFINSNILIFIKEVAKKEFLEKVRISPYIFCKNVKVYSLSNNKLLQ